MIIFSRVSAEALFFTFFFARKREKRRLFFVFSGVFVLLGGVFLCFLGVFFCFSRVSAIFVFCFVVLLELFSR